MKRYRGIISLIMIASVSLIFPSCATSGPKEPVPTPDYSQFKGYLFKLGEFEAGTFDTPPYIPTKVHFYLDQQLRGKKLLASEGDKKTLTVNVVSSTFYNFFRSAQNVRYYKELTSNVEVVDTSMPAIIARTTIHGYNAWGEVSSDFTEVQQVTDIVTFLEGIVR